MRVSEFLRLGVFFRVWGFAVGVFGVEGFTFGVTGAGLRVLGFGVSVSSLQVSRFRIFEVQGFAVRGIRGFASGVLRVGPFAFGVQGF